MTDAVGIGGAEEETPRRESESLDLPCGNLHSIASAAETSIDSTPDRVSTLDADV